MAYRSSLAERYLAVGSAKVTDKEDRSMKMAEIQGVHAFLGQLMTGGLDDVAAGVLGLSTQKSVPRLADYMKHDTPMEEPDGTE